MSFSTGAIFSNGSLAVDLSVARSVISTDEERRVYAEELLNTFDGFGSKYIEKMIVSGIKSPTIQKAMKELIVPFPVLKFFIECLSGVYDDQPRRTFLLDGKPIVSKLEEYMDKSKYHEDPTLKEKLDSIYNLEFCLRIKEAEKYANLLNTVVYKINNREGKLKLEFVPNNVAVVAEQIEDVSEMAKIYFLRCLSTIDNTLAPLYELWTPESYELTNGMPFVGSASKKIVESKENRAVVAMEKYFPGYNEDGVLKPISHIGGGFPPFVVLRNELATQGFWNIKNQDSVKVIKQIVLALTELRYLQRYGAFGLKYVIGAKLPEGTTMDLAGILEFNQPDQIPGKENRPVIGEFDNIARIKELSDSVMSLLTILFVMNGIDAGKLITSKDATTAESKQLDREELSKRIRRNQEIWKFNEENIFYTAICVYNRDNSSELPKGLSLNVDFKDSEVTAAEMEKKLNNFIVKIQNNFNTPIDWMVEQNPDLTTEEAQKLYEMNKAFNDSEMETETPEELQVQISDKDMMNKDSTNKDMMDKNTDEK